MNTENVTIACLRFWPDTQVVPVPEFLSVDEAIERFPAVVREDYAAEAILALQPGEELRLTAKEAGDNGIRGYVILSVAE